MSTVIGLTGGIASGKSTISKMLMDLGFPVIDADVVSREVVEVGEVAYQEIVKAFGEDVLLEDRTINRAKLGSIIFNNEEQRTVLNNIVHPAVRQRMNQLKDKYIKDGVKVVILDIPLLFESKLTHLVDKTLLVYVENDVQLTRLMKRNELTEDEARARIQSQMPLANKIALSDEVINNNGTVDESAEQLTQILRKWELI